MVSGATKRPNEGITAMSIEFGNVEISGNLGQFLCCDGDRSQIVVD